MKRPKPKNRPPPKKPARPKPAGRQPLRQSGEAVSKNLARVLKVIDRRQIADACGLSYQAVWAWRDIPPAHALAIETATAGKIKKEDLAPSFYPRPA